VGVSDAGQADQRPVVRAKGDIVVGLGQLRRLASDRVADDSEALLGAHDEAIEAARLASRRHRRGGQSILSPDKTTMEKPLSRLTWKTWYTIIPSY
jgi:hypothetical protein